ncbi:MAG: hypothetical protein ACJ8MH_19055 [Povalibacter sp.]
MWLAIAIVALLSLAIGASYALRQARQIERSLCGLLQMQSERLATLQCKLEQLDSAHLIALPQVIPISPQSRKRKPQF